MELKKQAKVLLLQIYPQYKNIEKSMMKADQLIQDVQYYEKDNLDILLLSEMVFTGYSFKNKEDIRPYLEEAGKGITFDWCSQQAKRLGCWVFCGYPEIQGEKMYNSQMVVAPDGSFVKSYKKHFLFQTDETWADEGPGFDTMMLKLPRSDIEIKVGHGICMDINPYKFTAPYEKFEFANYHLAQECQLILFSSAWIDPQSYRSDEEATNETMNYWLNRLLPILKDKNHSKPCYFVCSNRVGSEEGENYMGSSCIIRLKPLKVVKYLSRKEQNIILATLDL